MYLLSFTTEGHQPFKHGQFFSTIFQKKMFSGNGSETGLKKLKQRPGI